METLFTCQTQADFIRAASVYYQNKAWSGLASRPFYLEPRIDYTIMRWLYKLGRDRQVLEVDYRQFVRLIYRGEGSGLEYKTRAWRKWYAKRYLERGRTWYDNHGVVFRERMPKGIAKKKDRALEDPRADWREHKGFARDKGRAGYRRHAPKWFRKFCSRIRRRCVFKAWDAEDWDGYSHRPDAELFYDYD